MKKDFANNEDRYEQLIIRFLNGQLSIEETEELEKWIEASPENRDIFRIFQKTWLLSSGSLPDENFNTGKAWKKVSCDINKPSYRQKYQTRKKIRRLYLRLARIAAMIIAIFALGAITAYFTLPSTLKPGVKQIFEVSAPQGSRSRVVLPDSSIVWINAGSRITYNNDFNRAERILELEGEAHFDVVTDPRKPFVVKTSHLNVRAFGTQFNVRAYPDDDAVLTTLVEGNVVVEIPGEKRPIIYNIEPMQNLTYIISDMSAKRTEINEHIADKEEEKGKEPPVVVPPSAPKATISVQRNIRPELYISWKDETWVIEGETMADMAVMLGRRFNIRIHIQTDELKPYRFTGKIMNETLEQVLEILSMTTPLKYKVGKGNVEWEIDTDRQKEFDLLIQS